VFKCKILLINTPFFKARTANVEAKKAAMMSGAAINSTEGRAALHCALRAPKGNSPIMLGGVDQVAEVRP